MDGATETNVQPTTTEAAPEAVATDGGQGQGVTSGQGFFPSPDSLPDTLTRDQALELFKESDANITREFQRRAEQEKSLAQYADVGLTDYAPEDIGKLIAFAEIAANDDLFKDWISERAQELGLLEGEAPEQNAEVDDAGLPQELTPEAVQKIVADALAERETQAQQERQEAEQFAAFQKQIESDLAALKDEHGDFDEDEVLFQATRFEGDVKKGFEHLQKLRGTAQREVVEQKLGEKQPVTGGRADATEEPVTDFDTAHQRTLAAVRQSLSI